MSERAYTQEELANLELELKKNPSASINYVNLAEAQLALNKQQQAFSTYRAAKVICPDDPQVFNLGAKVLEALGKREEAVECLQKAILSGDKSLCSADSITHLAELLYNSGRKEAALSWLNKLVQGSENNPEALMKIAQIQLSLGNTDEGYKYLKLFRDKVGPTREMYLLMGETMLSRKFYDGAIKNYTDAIRSFPEDADFHLGLGKAWLGMNEKGGALKELSLANSLRSDDVRILLELGKLQSEMGMNDSADETFARIESSQLSNGEALFDIAKHFISSKKDLRALRYLEGARKLSPFHPEILKATAETNLRLFKYQEALEVLNTAISNDSKAIWAHESRVIAANALEDFATKAESQKALLDLKKSNAEDWCDYGETQIRLGQFEESEASFEQAAKLDHTCLRAYQAPEIIKLEKLRAKGEALAKQGEEALEKRFFLTASEKLEKALALVPNQPQWSKTLAEVALKTAEVERASQLLSVVRSSDPTNFEVSYELARTYEYLNNFQMAIELLSAITKDHPTELKAHLTLLRLKRCQIRGTIVTSDLLDSIIRNVEGELECIKQDSPVALLVKAYAYYIFSYGSSFQAEGIKKAEKTFKEAMANFGEIPEAIQGLCLVERVKGNNEAAIEYAKTLVYRSSNREKALDLAKLYENTGNFVEARKCYSTLRELFPENGFYRRKYVEMTAKVQSTTGKNELTALLSECHKSIMDRTQSIWPYYETAIGQEMASYEGKLSEEWFKRSMLSWRKAEGHPQTNSWVLWDMTRCLLKNLQGQDKLKSATSLSKLLEKNLREMPDQAMAYFSMAKCCLAFNDLTNKSKALNYLQRAWFIDQSNIEIGEQLAETAKGLGKRVIVDVIGYNVILSEPEIANRVFRNQ